MKYACCWVDLSSVRAGGMLRSRDLLVYLWDILKAGQFWFRNSTLDIGNRLFLHFQNFLELAELKILQIWLKIDPSSALSENGRDSGEIFLRWDLLVVEYGWYSCFGGQKVPPFP